MGVVFALACLGLNAAPMAGADTYGPGTITVAPASLVAGSTANTLTLRYSAPSTGGVSGTVAVVVPTSGAPTTGFSPVPATGNVSVQANTCTSAGLSTSPFTPFSSAAYPGDSPGTRVNVVVNCPAGRYFTLTYTNVAAPQRAQGYTFYTTVAGAPIKAQATGGGIAWAFMELPTLLVLMVLVMKWLKSDERRTRAAERRQVRGGDTDLVAYNAYLQTLNRADRAQR
jgi:hypothetical protein